MSEEDERPSKDVPEPRPLADGSTVDFSGKDPDPDQVVRLVKEKDEE
jgi:hypothetical protein